MSASSCVALNMPGSRSGEHFTVSEFSKPPAVTISPSATLLLKSSDSSLAKSALFSSRSMNCFQLLGKGTSVSIRRSGRLLPDPFRKDLVPAFIESCIYRIRHRRVYRLRQVELKICAKSPNVFACTIA